MAADYDWEALERPVSIGEPPAGAEVCMRVRGLHKRFGSRHVLRGIDLDIYRGETLVILGGSGSGKTTLLKHLMGVHRFTEGSIVVAGNDLRNMSEQAWKRYRERIGVVFQGAALLNSLTVFENVSLPLIEVEHRRPEEVRGRVVEALRHVLLSEDILDLKPADLSGGMRKRVGIARAIIRNPEIIYYDEPTTGLDPVTVASVNELTLSLQRELGVTSIVITHDLEAAFTVADRIALLFAGRIVALGDRETIRASEHAVLRQMLEGSTEGPLTVLKTGSAKGG